VRVMGERACASAWDWRMRRRMAWGWIWAWGWVWGGRVVVVLLLLLPGCCGVVRVLGPLRRRPPGGQCGQTHTRSGRAQRCCAICVCIGS
jgi:hypothetical protein